MDKKKRRAASNMSNNPPVPDDKTERREPGVSDETRVINSMEPNSLDGEGG